MSVLSSSDGNVLAADSPIPFGGLVHNTFNMPWSYPVVTHCMQNAIRSMM